MPVNGRCAMSEVAPITHDAAQRRFSATLRLYVGRGRLYSVAALAEATGVGQRTLKSYFEGATPGFQNWLILLRFLGSTFGAACMADAGVCAVVMRSDVEEACPHQTASEMASALSIMLKALEDGRIDHQERPELIRKCREAITSLSNFVASEEGRE